MLRPDKPVVPVVSQVQIEELEGDDLTVGAVTKQMSRIAQPMTCGSAPALLNFNVGTGKPATRPTVMLTEHVVGYTGAAPRITLRSRIRSDNLRFDQAWLPICTQGLAEFDTGGFELRQAAGCYASTQTFNYEIEPLTNPTFRSAYVQFLCTAKELNHNGKLFQEGDILTYVLHKGHVDPPVITIFPTTQQTFVPLERGQTMEIVTDPNEELEYVPRLGNTISRLGQFQFPKGSEAVYDRQLKLDRFATLSDASASEVIFVTDSNNELLHRFRTVIVPGTRGFGRGKTPVISNPMDGESIVYAYNLSGFVIKTTNRECRVRSMVNGAYVSGGHLNVGNSFESHVTVTQRRPFFTLKRQGSSLTIF